MPTKIFIANRSDNRRIAAGAEMLDRTPRDMQPGDPGAMERHDV